MAEVKKEMEPLYEDYEREDIEESVKAILKEIGENPTFKGLKAMTPLELQIMRAWEKGKVIYSDGQKSIYEEYAEGKNFELLAHHVNRLRHKIDFWGRHFETDIPVQVTKITTAVDKFEKTMHKAHRGLIMATYVLAAATVGLIYATLVDKNRTEPAPTINVPSNPVTLQPNIHIDKVVVPPK